VEDFQILSDRYLGRSEALRQVLYQDPSLVIDNVKNCSTSFFI